MSSEVLCLGGQSWGFLTVLTVRSHVLGAGVSLYSEVPYSGVVGAVSVW